MGYRKIPNLYKEDTILIFKQCWASEKIHGTSTHISYNIDESGEEKMHIFSGGCKHEEFIKIFDHEKLLASFRKLGHNDITVYGEGYGGKQQGMSDTYGKLLRFVAFEVKTGYTWLATSIAQRVCEKLGFDFVPYRLIDCDIASINAERDKPSEQSVKCGITAVRQREGVVLRPVVEMRCPNGDRVISKHKNKDFCETKSKREFDPVAAKFLSEVSAIADEWVTPMRLQHISDGVELLMENTGLIIKKMAEDIKEEAAGEFEESAALWKVVGQKTAKMWKEKVLVA